MLQRGLPSGAVHHMMAKDGVSEEIQQAVLGEEAAPAPSQSFQRGPPKASAPAPAAPPARPALDLGSVTLKKTTPAPPKPKTGPGGRPAIDISGVQLKATGKKLVEEEPETSWKKNWGAPKARAARDNASRGPAPKAREAVDKPKPKPPPKTFFDVKRSNEGPTPTAKPAPSRADPDTGMKVRTWVPMSERHPDKFKKSQVELMNAPKEKTTSLVPLPFKPRPYPDIPASPNGSQSPFERMMGPFLYKSVKFNRVNVNAAVHGQDILCLYFGASWRTGCKSFHSNLIDFYKLTCKDCKLELVYVSADRTMFEFKDIYAKFPFLAMPTGTADLKNQMTKEFQVVDMPMVVVLNAKTGGLITINGVEEIKTIPKGGRDREFAQNIVNQWKTRKTKMVKPPGGGGPAVEPPSPSARAPEGQKVGRKERKGVVMWKT